MGAPPSSADPSQPQDPKAAAMAAATAAVMGPTPAAPPVVPSWWDNLKTSVQKTSDNVRDTVDNYLIDKTYNVTHPSAPLTPVQDNFTAAAANATKGDYNAEFHRNAMPLPAGVSMPRPGPSLEDVANAADAGYGVADRVGNIGDRDPLLPLEQQRLADNSRHIDALAQQSVEASMHGAGWTPQGEFESKTPTNPGEQLGQIIDESAPATSIARNFPNLARALNLPSSAEHRTDAAVNPNAEEYGNELVPVGAAFQHGNGVTENVLKGVGDLAGGFTTPNSLAILVATGGLGAEAKALTAAGDTGSYAMTVKGLDRLVAAGFSGQMAADAVEKYPALRQQLSEGRYGDASRTLTQLLASGVLAGLTGTHAVKGWDASGAPVADTSTEDTDDTDGPGGPPKQPYIQPTLIDRPAGASAPPADWVSGTPMTPEQMEQQTIDDAMKRSRDEGLEKQYQGARNGDLQVNDDRSVVDKLRGDNLSEVNPSSTTPARRILLPGGKELLIPTSEETAQANRFVAPDLADDKPTTYDVPLAGGGVLRLPWDKAPVDPNLGQVPTAPLVRGYDADAPQMPAGALDRGLGLMGMQDNLSRTQLALPEGEPSPQLAAMRAARTALTSNPLAGPDVLRTAMGDDAPLVRKAAAKNLPTFLKQMTGSEEIAIQRQTGLSPEDFWRGSRKSKNPGTLQGTLTEAAARQIEPEASPEAPAQPLPTFAAPKTPTESTLPVEAPTAGVYGAETRVRTTAGDDIPARYKIVDLGEVKPSHSGTNFAPRADYGLENDRHYESDETERNKVIQNASARTPDNPKGYDPSFTVNDNPDATNGPPIVTPGGRVLGGNSRAMTLERVYGEGRGEEYKGLLREKATSYGLNPAEVGGMERPVLVREIPQPTDRAHAQRLITDLNDVPTHTLNEDAAALAFGRKLSDDSLSMMAHMIEENGGSLADVIRNKPNEMLALLRKDGALSDSKFNSIMDKVGKSGPEFTEGGKTFIKNALLSRLVGDYDTLRAAPDSAKDKVVGALGNLLYLKNEGGEWDLSPAVSEALKTITEAREHKISVTDQIQQDSMFSGTPRNIISDAVALKLDEGTVAFRKAVQDFAAGAKHEDAGPTMFSDAPQVDAAKDFDLAFAPKGDEAYGLMPGEYEAARKMYDNANSETEGGRGESPEQTEASGEEAAGSLSSTSNDVGKGEVKRPLRLPAPDDVDGWEKLQDDGLASYDFGRHEWQYTGPTSKVDGVILNSGFDPTPAFRFANRVWDQYIARPLQERLVGKWVTKRPVLDRIDPELAGSLNVYDNLHHYTLAKAQGIIHDVLTPLYDAFGVTPEGKVVNDAYLDAHGDPVVRAKGIAAEDVAGMRKLTPEEAVARGRAKERLLVLMADADSRENLRANHPDEYAAAVSDPAIQKALDIYRPAEQELTERREAMGGKTIDGDYLRRVYDMFTSGINKARAKTEGADPAYNALSRLVSEKDEAAPRYNLQRKADAEFYYQNGLHEFGPSFGPKYLGTTRRFGSNEVIKSFIEKATERPADGELPPSIDYNGTTFYRGDVAKDLRDSGKDRNAQSYDVFDPQQGNLFHRPDSPKYIAPSDVVKQLNGEMEMPDTSAGSFKRWMQDNALAFGFGIPHGMNLMRRLGHVVNWNPAEAVRVIASPELRQRAANVLADETGNALAQRGAIRSGDEDKLRGYIEGNLNPLNWQDSYLRNSMREGGKTAGDTTPLSVATSPLKIAGDIVSRINSLGHKALFDPQSFGGFGGLDQRVRLAAADYLKEKNPDQSDTEIASTINKAFGDYNRANWSTQQKILSNFLFFPGFETSTFQWVLDHPIKTVGSGALVSLLINRAVHSMGGNDEGDKNDLMALHIGNRTLHTGLFTEGMAMHLAAPLLAGLRSALLDDQSGSHALGEAAGKVPEMAQAVTDPVLPIYRLAFQLADNKNMGRDTTKPEDKFLPGTLGNKANDEYAAQIASSLLPEFSRFTGSQGHNGVDAFSLLGGAMGVTNREVTPDDKVRAATAKAITASAVFRQTMAKQGETGGQALLRDDPDTIVYAAFEPALAARGKTLREWDQAAEMIKEKLSGEQRDVAMKQLSDARAADAAASDQLTKQLQSALAQVHAHRNTVAAAPGSGG